MLTGVKIHNQRTLWMYMYMCWTSISITHRIHTCTCMYMHMYIHVLYKHTFSECILMHLFLVATDFLILDLKLHTVKRHLASTFALPISSLLCTLHMYIHALILHVHVHVCTSQTTCTCTLILHALVFLSGNLCMHMLFLAGINVLLCWSFKKTTRDSNSLWLIACTCS